MNQTLVNAYFLASPAKRQRMVDAIVAIFNEPDDTVDKSERTMIISGKDAIEMFWEELERSHRQCFQRLVANRAYFQFFSSCDSSHKHS